MDILIVRLEYRKQTKTLEVIQMTKEQRAINYAERHGIIDYTIKGNTMRYYETFYSEGTYKCEVNLTTMKETRTHLKRVRKVK
jgi:hypothetical protein